MTVSKIRQVAYGRALRTRESIHQTISKTVGLAVFASDSLSSVAYAGGEILLILAVLGASYYWMAIPITVAICGLLILLTLSYRQTIFAYPGGGGAYIVSRDNFGERTAQVAGAALLVDYILTVAVSIAAGVDQIASMFPVLFGYKVQIALLLVLLITMINLRGVKESGRVFAIPTYWFVAMIGLLFGVGFFQAITGNLNQVTDVPQLEHGVETLTGFALVFLLLRAFSSGTTALTGVEAISNGITAFKRPSSRNAATTLLWDAALLMVMFLGLGILGYLVGAQPSEKEVLISQISRAVYGEGIHAVPHPALGDDHPDHGREHQLRRVSPPGSLAGGRRLPAAPFHLPRQPPGLQLGRHPARRLRQPADHHLSGQRQPADPPVRHRRVPQLHPFSVWDGPALAQDRPAHAQRAN